jgi:hypothetical protein
LIFAESWFPSSPDSIPERLFVVMRSIPKSVLRAPFAFGFFAHGILPRWQVQAGSRVKARKPRPPLGVCKSEPTLTQDLHIAQNFLKVKAVSKE